MKRLASIFHIALLPLGCLAANASLAADSASGEALETVEVYGNGYRTTGTKSQLQPYQAPISYEIYNAELLARRQVDSVNDALRYVPGITAESRGTVTIFDQYTIRGFESYYNYYDGLPLQYNGAWNALPQVDVFATESIEVLKGPVSSIYGSAPPGGLINQTAKQPQADQSTRLRVRTGTSDLRELAGDVTGPISESINYRVIALARKQDGQQQTTEEERVLLAPSVQWQLAERTSLNLNVFYQDDPELIPSTPLPGIGTVFSANEFGRLNSDAFAGDNNWSGYEREITMLGYKLDHQFSDQVSFLQNFRYTTGDVFQRNTYNQGFIEAPGEERNLARSAYFTDETIDGFVVDNQLAINFGGDIAHRLLIGVDYQQLNSDIEYGDTLGTDTPAIDLSSPNNNLFNVSELPFDTYSQFHDIEQEQLGLYAQDEIFIDQLTIIASLRYDQYDSQEDFEFLFTGATIDSGNEKIDQDQFSGRLAAIYTFENGLAPYINYSESFEPVAGINSDTGEAFDPTIADQIEAGIKYRNNANRLSATLAAYRIRQQNVVISSADFTQSTQAGEVQSQGLELAVDAWLTKTLSANFTYDYTDVEITDNPLRPAIEGNTPIWVADQQANLWLNFTPTPKLEFSAGVRYTGERQLDQANSDQLPSYTLFDLVVSYDLNQQLQLGLSASNLTDKEYVASCFDIGNCWFGPERSVELSVNWQL